MSGIFRDPEKLSPTYIPEKLYGREGELETLSGFFEDFLSKPGDTYPVPVQVLGPVGSGKTSLSRSYSMRLERECSKLGIKLKTIYVNCKARALSRRDLYSFFLREIGSTLKGLSTSLLLEKFLELLYEGNNFALIILDEVDYLVMREKIGKEEGSVIYDLTRLNEIAPREAKMVVGVIFISRDRRWHSMLDESEISTLGYRFVRLSRYGSETLERIMCDRIEDAFRCDVDDGAVELIAHVAANKRVNPGDARFALDALYLAGKIAEREGGRKVSLKHARMALGDMIDGITSEDLMGMNREEILVLLGAARACSYVPFAPRTDVYEEYRALCEERGVKPITSGKFNHYLTDLRMRGLINESERGIYMVWAPFMDLEDRLERVLRRFGIE